MKGTIHQAPNIPIQPITRKNRRQMRKPTAYFRMLLQLLVKHYQLILKSKITIATLIFGPLLMLFIIGLAFTSANEQFVSLGVFSPNESIFVEDFLSELDDSLYLHSFDSLDDCETAVILGDTHACLVFPEQFNPEDEEVQNALLLKADFSQPSRVYIILEKLNGYLDVQADAFALRLVTDLVSAIETSSDAITLAQKEVDSARENRLSATSALAEATSSLLLDISLSQETAETYDISAMKDDLNQLQIAASSLVALQETILVDKADLEELLGEIQADIDTCKEANDSCSSLEEEYDRTEDALFVVERYVGEYLGDDIDGYVASIDMQLQEVATLQENLVKQISEAKIALTAADEVLRSTRDSVSSATNSLSRIKNNIDMLTEQQAIAANSLGSVISLTSENIANPLPLDVEPLDATDSYFSKLFPNILILFIMLTSILLASMFIIIERQSNAFIRNTIAPIHDSLFPLSSLICLTSIVFLETVLLFFIAYFLFGALLQGIFVALLSILFAIIFFVLVGMVIGLFFDNEESVSLSSIFLTTVLIVFSGLLFPVATMSSSIARFTALNPFELFSNITSKSLIYNVSLQMTMNEIILMCSWIIFVGGLLALVYLRSKKKHW